MKPLKVKFVIKILEENGFVEVRQTGSHIIFKNGKGIMIPVPMHGKNKEIPVGTMLAIIKQSELAKEIFEKK